METQDGNERPNERPEDTNRKSQLLPVSRDSCETYIFIIEIFLLYMVDGI